MDKSEMSTLCFVYIKDDMFKGQNFNFDNKYCFKVIESDHRFLITVAKKEKDTPEQFFGKNISSVTALVGKNGSGKTKALRSIFDNIGIGLTAMYGEYFIYIFRCGNKYCWYSGISNLDISSDFKKLDIDLIKGDDFKPKGESDFRKHTKFFSKFVLFTNVFDVAYRSRSSKHDFCIDLSLVTEINELSYEKMHRLQDSLKYNVVHKALEFANSEVYSELKSLELESLPDLIRIRSIKNSKDDVRISNELEKHRKEFYYDYIVNWGNVTKRHLRYGQIINDNSLNYEEALNSFALSFLLYLDDINQGIDISEYISQLAVTDKDGIELLYEFVKQYNLDEKYTNILYLVNSILIRRVPPYILAWQPLDEFVIRIDKEVYGKITQIVDLIHDTEKLSEYIDVDLKSSPGYERGNYSTGEFYRFRMFTKFFELYQTLKEENPENKNILLLFDEIDVYYHPSLQTRVMNDLLSFLGTLFKEYNLQIIITTNNPYILSDIPNDNIIYLDRAQIVERNTLTFGANIHSLLKDSFYLDSTRGVFCKEIINNVAKFLDNIDDKDSYPKEYCQYVIENIGESIIRKKLEQMYFRKYIAENKKEDQIDYYRKEILKLQDRLVNKPPVQSDKLNRLKQLLKLTQEEVVKLTEEYEDD